ncbi:hypothetical protein [Paenibacillus sp. R14(2021)]|uniref:hypothetical protein n=1 Tax=Paenibacillus sp. R14(2021) TaxID=2859228 RepID=UPI001C611941|nr:hypothetical protein [Paenibacillus sp. R14(2021)]
MNRIGWILLKWRHAARLWNRSDGTVSVYLIVSTAAMLLFTSLLIDYARIAAFNKKSELAAQSSIRSALSAYDDALYERYGLFGAGGSDRNELFTQAIQHNLDEEEDGFRLLRIQREASHVDRYEVLGNQQVFSRQVLEEMKYKAPIDFTLEIASRFAPMSSAMKEAAATVNALEDIRRMYDEREKRLALVMQEQKQAAVQSAQAASAVQAAAGIAGGYGAYESWLQSDAMLDEDEKPLHSDEIAAYRSQALGGSASVKASTAAALENHREVIRLASTALSEAEQWNASMTAAVARMRKSEEGGGFDRLGGMAVAGQENSSMGAEELSQLGQTRESADNLLIKSEWFQQYRQDLNEQNDSFQRIDIQAGNFQQAVQSAIAARGASGMLDAALSGLREASDTYMKRYSQPGEVLSVRQKELTQRQSSDSERKSNESAAKSKWSQVKAMIDGMKTAPNEEEHRAAFERVKKLADANLAFNKALADEADGEKDAADATSTSAGEEAKSSMAAMGTVFGGMADLLGRIRDPLYINEYVVHRFHTFDPKWFQEAIKGNNEAFSKALSLDNQEAEYILYGFHEPGANVAAAYGELFAARVAVRTMEGLIACRALGNPLLVLSAAVLYGLEKSIADMAKLAETGKVQLSKYMPVELTYSDYLRIFLILHGSGGQGRLARMIAVIEYNTGADLLQTATGLSGELTSSVNLWFLPGLVRSFAAAGILKGKVKGNRYEKTQTIGSSYG